MPASPSPIPGQLAKTLTTLQATQDAVKAAAAGTYKTPAGVVETPAPATPAPLSAAKP